jgi:CHAD domain-containing protein
MSETSQRRRSTGSTRAGRGPGTRQIPAETLGLLTGSLKKQWKRYRKALKRCQEDFTEAAVHASRVETRRLLSVLELMGPFLETGQLKKMRAVLKRHMDTFDALRDTQVQVLAVDNLLKRFPELTWFDKHLRRRESRLRRDTRANLCRIKTRRLGKLIDASRAELEQWDQQNSTRPAAEILLGAVDTAFARTRALQEAIDPGDTATIHRTRVAFKRFRYMVETLAEELPLATQARLKELHGYQTMMGEIQDAEVLGRAFREFLGKKQVEAPSAARIERELTRRRDRRLRFYLRRAGRLKKFWPRSLGVGAPTPAPPVAERAGG